MSNFDREDRFGGWSRWGFWWGSRWGRDSGRREGRPEMFSVVCDECGSGCQVPFKPTGDRPVYCSDCFRDMDWGWRDDRNDRGRWRDDRNDRWGRSGGWRDEFGERKMFPAVCDQCGNDCELPFKPMSDKPVFCSDCFVKEDKPKKGWADYKAEFEALNAKLDLIIKHLGIKEITEEAETPVKVKAVKVAKEEVEIDSEEEIETPVKVKAVKKVAKKEVKTEID